MTQSGNQSGDRCSKCGLPLAFLLKHGADGLCNACYELDEVRSANLEDLPLMLGSLAFEESKKLLAERLKGRF